ncbi:MAG: phosphatase PAP2 family protein [Candidatus Omnitrophota bacterium]
MKKVIAICLLVILLIFPYSAYAESEDEGRIAEIIDDSFQDLKNFYSGENLIKLAIGLGVSGILANTSADQDFRQWYQDEIRSGETDDFEKAWEPFGDLKMTAPAYLGAVVIGELTKDTQLGSVIGEWGWRSTRTLFIGAPQMVFWQYALGAQRPTEGDSDWRFYDDNNSVSGHSFLGAIPFLSAAKMVDNFYLKSAFYAASTFPGISRINKDKHYLSQVMLGWWIAYLSASSVDKTEEQRVVITPALLPGGAGIKVTARF